MASDQRSSPTVRPFLPGDLSALLTMNNAAVPAVSDLTAEAFLDLINGALVCLVAEADGEPAGFLLCLGHGVDYDSPNYVWLSERFTDFAYTDRICVDETMRGRKLGDALYGALFQRYAGTGKVFLCEVNERPPNPGSLRFHKRLGFEEVGKADHGDKAVVYLKRAAQPAGQAKP
ncbi:GNAT family N-acetyltransferase [Roseibium sp. Sym1]|uniref:GNAT family N-acetyltransferase n=1 Tax=Roseibium sp. Sym1 TaxID=3016006 RepID=UPI0022B3075E|nr:GNAT family N-acetyltransferase [Roseibium sp. Sym1]